jgi:hypothetical protein
VALSAGEGFMISISPGSQINLSMFVCVFT